MSIPEPVLDLLQRQRGLVADHQLRIQEPRKAGRRSIHRHPEIERLSPRVLRHRAVPPSVEQQLMLAVLDAGPGAVLWGKSAASHFGFSRYRRLPAHVAVPRNHLRGERAGELHVVRSLAPEDVTTHLDIPVSRPERTVLWLAGMLTHRYGHEVASSRAAVILDQAWRQGLIDGRTIHALADRLGGRGRSGIVVLRALLEDRPPDYTPAGSRLEERFEELLPAELLSELERQVTVDAETVIRTVDYRLRRWPLIAEINGEAFHSSLSDREADDARYARLLGLGYSVVVFWEHDIWHEGDAVRSAMKHLFRHPDPRPTLHRPTPAPWQT